MANILIRNLPDEVHRVLRIRAAHHGISTEAEIREILEAITQPSERIKLGSLLTSIARGAGGLTDAEVKNFDHIREKTPAEPIKFE